MIRILLVTLFAVGLLSASPAAPAQSTRAYAPENLRQLAIPDRKRVIEHEYADQSNGRQIPDDQLAFYLHQVDSGWTFSRIKQDIATSLRGQGGGSRPGFGGRPGRPGFGARPGGGSDQTLRCESTDNRYRECPIGFPGQVRLSRQLSDSACIEGSTWGQRNGAIWVNRGCRGEFQVFRRGPRLGPGPVIRGNSDYSVTCNSDRDRRRTCAWDASQGHPALIEQLSRTACVEGRTWGYDRNTLWVDGGCRARFGVR